MQRLDLVERRFNALLTGEKTDTIRIGEGEIVPGLLVYDSYPSRDRHAVVLVTASLHMRLEEVALRTGEDAGSLVQKMKQHYPEITLDTEVLFVEHLTPHETRRRMPSQVEQLLAQLERNRE